jgi:hypothetical protein
MASVSIVNSFDSIQITVDFTGCSGVLFVTHKLYQNSSLYTSFSTTGPNHTFVNVPVGFDYYVISDIYVTGPTLCESPTSNTVTITSYCIPAGQTNIKLSLLADFYSLPSFDILLSGPNNPSSGNSIFGKSALPSSGSPSKTRPNSISELRNTCGGARDVFANFQSAESYFNYKGTIGEFLNCGFKVDGINGLFYTLESYPPFSDNLFCTLFDKTRNEIRQSNGVIGVDTIGTKTLKIGFTETNTIYQLTGTVTVKRLSDNTTLTSTSFNHPAGSNLYTTLVTVSWTNSVTTKVAVIVDVDQPTICIS